MGSAEDPSPFTEIVTFPLSAAKALAATHERGSICKNFSSVSIEGHFEEREPILTVFFSQLLYFARIQSHFMRNILAIAINKGVKACYGK